MAAGEPAAAIPRASLRAAVNARDPDVFRSDLRQKPHTHTHLSKREEHKLSGFGSNKSKNVGNRAALLHAEWEALFSQTSRAYRARAVPAAICPALVLPVDDPLDAAGPLTIAAFQPVHLLLRPGQLLEKKTQRDGEKIRGGAIVRPILTQLTAEGLQHRRACVTGRHVCTLAARPGL